MIVFSILDVKAEAYLPPFFAQANGEAIRAFKDLVNTPGHQFNRHPGDYMLCRIGTFDVSTGVIEGELHFSLGHGLEYFESEFMPLLSEVANGEGEVA